jgi:isopentenyldiphosphate isomerase
MWDVSSAGIHDCILFILVGHIQAGDDAVGTAIRELKEELSIEAKPEELEKIYSYKQNSIQKDGAFINNEHVTVFLLNKDIPDLNVLKLQKDEVEQVEWIPLYIYERELKRPNSKFVPLFNEKIKNALVQILWGHAIEYYKFPVTLTDCQ